MDIVSQCPPLWVSGLNATDKMPIYEMSLTFVFGGSGFVVGGAFFVLGFERWRFVPRSSPCAITIHKTSTDPKIEPASKVKSQCTGNTPSILISANRARQEQILHFDLSHSPRTT